MQTLWDEDGNVWNVRLEIHDGQLYARQTADDGADLYRIDLERDIIDITLT